MSLSKLQETVEDRGARRAVIHGVAERQTGLSDQQYLKRLKSRSEEFFTHTQTQICEVMDGLAKSTVVIISQYTYISNNYVASLKFTPCFTQL